MIIPGDDPVSKAAQRFEVFTGAGKRRDWPPEVKAAIVAECCSGREGVSAVARRHGLDPSQVYAWRKDLLRQIDAQKLAAPSAEAEVAAFVPAVIEPGAVPDPAPARRASRRRTATAAIELEIDGVAVKIARGADAGVIAAVIEALKATR
jgi:transposase